MGVEPLVSICIPAYNNAAFIERAIHSVLTQTHRKLELIINDDGSGDGTADKIRQFDDPRLSLVENGRNLGIGENFIICRVGAAHAKPSGMFSGCGSAF